MMLESVIINLFFVGPSSIKAHYRIFRSPNFTALNESLWYLLGMNVAIVFA